MKFSVGLNIILGWGFGMALIAAVYAQDAKDRQNAALPFLAEQRTNALDAVALCQGDLALLKAQLADVQKKLTEAEAKIPK